MPSTRQLAAIMFTDIVGYTALMGRDEQKAFDILHKNRELQRPLIEQYNGRWIKELGDGVLASFPNSTDAVQTAIQIQRECNQSKTFALRIGIHQGEVIFEGDDIFGDAVNIASRIQALAPVGGIWISEAVHHSVANKHNITTLFVKEEWLKNVQEPIRIYEVPVADNGIAQQSTKVSGPSSTSLKRKSYPFSKPVLFTLGVFLLAAICLFIYTGSTGKEKEASPASTAAVHDKSIAVLPFVNMSNDKEQEYFSDGLSEELLNLLAKIPGLKVIARTSSFAFKGKNEDVRTISEKLGVAHVLEGSVRKSGNQLRITAQLIKAHDGTHLWSQTYDRVMDEIFKVQDEIATAVVRELKLKLLASSGSSSSANPEVHNLILQGNYYYDKLDKENVAKALDYYKQAVALDSTDARAWAKIASATSRQAWQNYINQKEGYEKAKQAALKSVALNPNSTDGLIALGAQKMYYDFDWKGAQEAFKKVLLLEPANADALNNIGCLYQMQGQWNKAIEVTKQALALDPLKPIFYSNQGANFTYAGRIKEANAMYRKALEVHPQFQRAHMYLGRNYLLQGKSELALLEMQKENVEVFRHFGLALGHHALGDTNQANQLLKSFIYTYQKEWPYLIAELYGFREEKEKAVEWLQRAYEQNDSWLIWIKGDPLLKSIWNTPQYASILKRMHLPV